MKGTLLAFTKAACLAATLLIAFNALTFGASTFV